MAPLARTFFLLGCKYNMESWGGGGTGRTEGSGPCSELTVKTPETSFHHLFCLLSGCCVRLFANHWFPQMLLGKGDEKQERT